jgi:cytochrome c oxidase cbb3-type subunit 3
LHGAVIFSLFYWLVVETIGVTDTAQQALQKEMVIAAEVQLARAAESGLSNESLELMSTVPDRVAAGRELFTTYCVVCHLDSGGGSVGPNLTDNYWIHGPEPMDHHQVVTNGVPAKGMAAWGNQLGPRRVELLVAYVLTLTGTNVPGGKAPEGQLYEEADTP